MSTENFEKALKEIDRFNSQDPRQKIDDGIAHPQELIYSKSLTEWVLKLDPQASEALRVAARGQHIGRWTIPRSEYPAGRSGYLRWREELKAFHVEKIGAILRDIGYEEDFIERVASLMSKNNMKEDPDAQTLEDGLCLVFFETQFMDLVEKTPADKMKIVVRKTWKKMGPKGREIALKLKLPFEVKRFLGRSNWRCAALSRSVQRPKGARLSAALGRFIGMEQNQPKASQTRRQQPAHEQIEKEGTAHRTQRTTNSRCCSGSTNQAENEASDTTEHAATKY